MYQMYFKPPHGLIFSAMCFACSMVSSYNFNMMFSNYFTENLFTYAEIFIRYYEIVEGDDDKDGMSMLTTISFTHKTS